jgi:8-oxo-dGTP pyrophosphatase MutT (NUDIX family)
MPDRLEPATPRHSATVILLRESSDGIEVLLTRRHDDMAFMGGMWVFPGGAMSPADFSAEALERIPEFSRLRCARFCDQHGDELDERERLGLAVAAHRETFEETGLLLATGPGGVHLRNELLTRAQSQRRAIVSDPALFAALLREQALQLEVDRLTYWAHWITPSSVSRRFDTRFFAVPVPPGQSALIDSSEAVDHTWMTPEALIAAAANRSMSLPQPTLYNLMQLAAEQRSCGSLEAVLSVATRRRVEPVLPKMIRHDGSALIVLPWDPEYQALPGKGVRADIDYPSTLRTLPSRMPFER